MLCLTMVLATAGQTPCVALTLFIDQYSSLLITNHRLQRYAIKRRWILTSVIHEWLAIIATSLRHATLFSTQYFVEIFLSYLLEARAEQVRN